MTGRRLFILTILCHCGLSLPVTSSHLENEDVKVMRCIVEALADVLSRPHPLPVSQECLVILRADDMLVTILRRHNFLKELQSIAVEGGHERAQLQGDAAAADHVTRTPKTTDDVADQSMLEAMGGPGERSIRNQKRTGNGDRGEEEDERLRDKAPRERDEMAGKEPEEREKDESPGNHVSGSANDWGEGGEADKREEEKEDDEDGEEEKRAHSEEGSEEGFEEEDVTMDKKGDESEEKGDAPGNKSEEKKSAEEHEEERDEGVERERKRNAFFSHDDTREEREQEEDEVKRGSRGSLKRWIYKVKSVPMKKRAGEREGEQLHIRQDVPHHSEEVVGEDGDKKKGATQSLEEKELQMIAQKAHEERRGLEEEGSAGRKPEEPEIESLAAIESELESVAQKLHDLRRG